MHVAIDSASKLRKINFEFILRIYLSQILGMKF